MEIGANTDFIKTLESVPTVTVDDAACRKATLEDFLADLEPEKFEMPCNRNRINFNSNAQKEFSHTQKVKP